MIDWNKPLECDHGDVYKLGSSNTGKKVGCGEISWWVDSDGIPSTLWMPAVRNKKRKPKEGEWWMCLDKDDKRVVMYFIGAYWSYTEPSAGEVIAMNLLSPVHPMIVDRKQ